MMRKSADAFELAVTADDVERIFKKGKIASLIGMEGGHSIDNSLGALRMFYRLGARYMTLTHSRNLPWADSATDKPQLGGLSAFGEQVVKEMNRLGMLVDLSHVSPDTMEDAIRVSQAPVIFSHSSQHALNDVARNVPDHVLKLMPSNGGMVMVTFVPGFLAAGRRVGTRRRPPSRIDSKQQFPSDENAVKTRLEAWRQEHPEPRATLREAADHVDHIRRSPGSITSDSGAISMASPAFPKASKTCRSSRTDSGALRRGYTDDDIKKVLGLNVLRVMREVEKVSKRLDGRGQSYGLSSEFHVATTSHRRARRLHHSGYAGVSVAAGSAARGSRRRNEPAQAHWLMDAHPDWEVLNRGVNGERSDQIRARFPRDVLDVRPEAVVIIAGVNDVH